MGINKKNLRLCPHFVCGPPMAGPILLAEELFIWQQKHAFPAID